jgi:23S rRNA (pseudouridine1915-N3)-methyltransferase
MNITIITVGKIKEKYLKDAIDEYKKRLSRYCKLEVIELQDEKTPDNASEKEEEIIRSKEGELILKYVKDNMFVITLEIQGKLLTSEELAAQVKELGVRGESNIAFIIGGSLGLAKAVQQRSNYKLSFSKMTFPHQLFRVMLLEQVYRAFRIIHGEPYHK